VQIDLSTSMTGLRADLGKRSGPIIEPFTSI